jgi:hypothetical protein
MSTTATTNHPLRETGRPAGDTARPAATRSRLRHTPGGMRLGVDAGREAQRLAAAILEVLAGVRTPGQAAETLGISLQRYFQMETRAMQALVTACQPRARGRSRSADKELIALRRQYQRLERELSRQQTLVRLAQRSIGLPPPRPPAPPAGKDKRKKRPRRPVVRALRAAEALQRRCQEAASAESPRAETASSTLPPSRETGATL